MLAKLKSLISQVRIGLIVVGGVFVLILLAKLVPEGADLQLPDLSVTDDANYKIIDWRTLRGLDIKTGAISDDLKALEGKEIKIPGFIVPLEDNLNHVSEFLLVPSPQACIHVPPPPANQMIYVKMQKPFSFQWGSRAVWLHGILSFKATDSPYGKISFEVQGQAIKNFSSLDL